MDKFSEKVQKSYGENKQLIDYKHKINPFKFVRNALILMFVIGVSLALFFTLKEVVF